MIRQILLGSATAFLVTGSASALTMSVTGDNRAVYAEAFAGFDSDTESGPAPVSSTYDESVSASAVSGVVPILFDGGSGGGAGIDGAVANASAGQFSEINALSISGSGFADASGNHGFLTRATLSEADGSGGGGGLFFDEFESSSYSLLEVLFSIDEDAEYDLGGFLYAGNEVAIGEGDIINRASIILINTDTLESAYKAEISNDTLGVNESGVIGAGNYRFTVRVDAEVDGGFDLDISAINGGGGGTTNGFGYATSAGYKGIGLQLSAIDKPIPEPVTTTLAAMGLGALVLRTSRRRHH